MDGMTPNMELCMDSIEKGFSNKTHAAATNNIS